MREYWTLEREELLLVLLVMFAYAYFFASGSWNQNARLDAIYSFVEPGPDQYTFRINRFVYDPVRQLNTGDWARFESNFYANKAPGTILLGIFVYFPLHWFETAALGFNPYHPLLEVANAYFINLGVSVVFAAVGALFFVRLLERLGVVRREALVVTLLWVFATAQFPYSTTLWGTATTTALVVGGYLGLVISTRRSIVASGFSFGFAVCSDYLALVFVVVAAVYLALHHRALLAWFCLGGIPALVVLMSYQAYCFNNPFTTASSLSQVGFLDPNRWLGLLGWPAPQALVQLTVGPHRGVFFQMPVLLLGAVGYWFWFRRERRDPWLWLGLSSFVVPLVLVSQFNGWHGGASVSARYLIPAFPALLLGLKELPRSRPWFVALALVAGVSLFNMFAVAATNTIAPDDVSEPLYSWVYPQFFGGELGTRGQHTRLQALHPAWRQIAPLTCFNLGEVLGLSSYPSLLPWFLGCGLGLHRLFRKARAPESPPQSREKISAL